MTLPSFFFSCANLTRKEKNQMKPADRSEKGTLTPCRLFSTRALATGPALKGAGSPDFPSDRTTLILSSSFWVQYSKI